MIDIIVLKALCIVFGCLVQTDCRSRCRKYRCARAHYIKNDRGHEGKVDRQHSHRIIAKLHNGCFPEKGHHSLKAARTAWASSCSITHLSVHLIYMSTVRCFQYVIENLTFAFLSSLFSSIMGAFHVITLWCLVHVVYSNKWTACAGQQVSGTNWMCKLNERSKATMGTSPLINTINIPGTHDSAAYVHEGVQLTADTICQIQSILDQLKMGIRYFDLRVIYDKSDQGPNGHGDVTRAFHSCHYKNKLLSWKEIHAQLTEFRQESGGTECIFLAVKDEMGNGKPEEYWKQYWSSTDDNGKSVHDANAEFAVPFVKMIKDLNEQSPMYYIGDTVPTIEECDGKVVIRAVKGKKGAEFFPNYVGGLGYVAT